MPQRRRSWAANHWLVRPIALYRHQIPPSKPSRLDRYSNKTPRETVATQLSHPQDSRCDSSAKCTADCSSKRLDDYLSSVRLTLTHSSAPVRSEDGVAFGLAKVSRRRPYTEDSECFCVFITNCEFVPFRSLATWPIGSGSIFTAVDSISVSDPWLLPDVSQDSQISRSVGIH